MLLGKIHRAVVTEANLDYVGSITIDRALFVAAGLLEYERVQVVNINNGNRLETYTIISPLTSGKSVLVLVRFHVIQFLELYRQVQLIYRYHQHFQLSPPELAGQC